MKNVILIISVLYVSIGLQAQSNKVFNKIDKYALKTPKKATSSIDQLSSYLTEPYKDDLEKVRSIFTWVIYNIQYDNAAYNKGNKRINTSNEDVLKRRKAVCFGYSTLFKALCEQANIPAEVIVGFSKGTLTATKNLGEPDHAWNAVKIKGSWQLLDVTWASSLLYESDVFMATLNTNYFLPASEDLILNHLPTDPMWQLLDCIVTPDIFIKNSSAIKNYLETTENCIDYTDTLAQYEELQGLQKRIDSEKRAYYYHPTIQMAREYGHTLMDYEGQLSDIEEILLDTPHLDSLIGIQQEMLRLCEKAAGLTPLFPNQIENCAYTRLNYAVALSQKINSIKLEERSSFFEIMKTQTLQAKKELEQLPTNYLIENALERCQQILEYLK